MRLLTLALAAAYVVAASSVAAVARPALPEDLARLQYVGDPAISPDGTQVAYVVRIVDVTKNAYRSAIWLAAVSGTNAPRQLTRGDDDSGPVWAPDGRTLAFDRAVKDQTQIYIIALSGGEARELTHEKNGASGAVWSHDGRRIAYGTTTKDDPAPLAVDWAAAGASPPPEHKQTDTRTIRELRFSLNGPGYVYDKHRHIAAADADGGHAVALTSGNDWSETDPVWSPDDKTIVFASARNHDPAGSERGLYAIPSAGGAFVRLLLPHHSVTSAAFTPDGARMLYHFDDARDPAGYAGVGVADVRGTDERVVVPPNTVAWGDAVLADTRESGAGCGPIVTADGRSFVELASVPGATALSRYDVASGAATRLTGGDAEIGSCSMSRDGSKIAYDRSDASHPNEIYVYDSLTGRSTQLTDANAAYRRDVPLSDAVPFAVRDEAGLTVHAWIVHPPHATPGRKYPTLLEIHGGPQTEFGNSYFHEFQMLASHGYNVVFADPRGSVGFGYPFESALSKNWGDPMYADEMAVVDAAIRRPEVDASKLGVLGGSYGGYATLWIIGHTTRFKGAVAERAVSDLQSLILAADFAGANDPTYAWGNAWDHQQTYWDQSPLKYVANVRTPVLIVHSENDIRTPIDQTLQEFDALRVLGRTAEYLEFPRETHDLNRTGEPIHRIERLHRIEDWLDRYVRA